jgi:hypothetical protein
MAASLKFHREAPMDAPLIHTKNNEDAATQPIEAGETTPRANEAGQSAADADRMLRMIVGSTYIDPQDIRRKLDDQASRDAADPGRDLNFGLVILAAALVFLIFACDLIFMRG